MLDPLEMVWLDRLNLLKSGHLLDTTLLKLVIILPVNLLAFFKQSEDVFERKKASCGCNFGQVAKHSTADQGVRFESHFCRDLRVLNSNTWTPKRIIYTSFELFPIWIDVLHVKYILK